jgi:hypothetical protein
VSADLDQARLVISPGALLTRARAIELLPVGTRDERARWLEQYNLVRYLFGRPVVRWGDVLAALDEPERKPESRPTAPTAARVRL